MGADKISINSPALNNPDLINQLHDVYGQQCVGLVSTAFNEAADQYEVYKFTGDEARTQKASGKPSIGLKKFSRAVRVKLF